MLSADFLIFVALALLLGLKLVLCSPSIAMPKGLSVATCPLLGRGTTLGSCMGRGGAVDSPWTSLGKVLASGVMVGAVTARFGFGVGVMVTVFGLVDGVTAAVFELTWGVVMATSGVRPAFITFRSVLLLHPLMDRMQEMISSCLLNRVMRGMVLLNIFLLDVIVPPVV